MLDLKDALPFLERGLRVQADRDQRVVTGGPYRIARYPLYAGMMLQALGLPLLLGSRWALLPAVAFVLLLARRTAIEDRMLQRDLEGYAQYAQRTRARLLPGLG
jgi:protein-S-isoprenylcysteine O-methyltransferase Ste14